MAESSVLELRKNAAHCRFFASGICREGDRCKYLHDAASDGEQTNNVIKVKVTPSQKLKNTSDVHEECSGTSSDNINSNGFGSNQNAHSLPSNNAAEETVDNASANNHCLSRESQPDSEQVICKYFQDGSCRFGERCFNKHDLVESSAISEIPTMPDNLPLNSDGHVDEEPSTSLKDSASVPKSPSTENSEGESKQWLLEQHKVQSKTKLRVNAPEFIPSGFLPAAPTEPPIEEVNISTEGSARKTWAQVVNSSAGNGVPSPYASLCPFAQAGECQHADCTYVHGDICEFCGNACLHPTNEEQRKSHTDDCIKQHEREMELAFAVARSKDKQCGVCFEVVVDKNPASEQRFGILPNCNHCFCLACIRKWRQATQFENKIIRACPECRVTSDFVCPSMYWVDTKEEKDKLIMAYKDALSNKQCKYFRQGRGKCPFGNKCFYLHAYPDGTKVDTGPPIRRHRHNADGEADVLQLLLWDFLDERDNRWLYSLDDLDLMAILSEPDDSDSSDIELF